MKTIPLFPCMHAAANPCGRSRCSHLCLLSASEVRGFSCACPTGMVLLPDGLICHCKMSIIYYMIHHDFVVQLVLCYYMTLCIKSF